MTLASTASLRRPSVKLTVVTAVMACQFAAFLPQAPCQQNQTPQKQSSRLHLRTGTEASNINMAASSIQREDPPAPRPSPYASVIRLKGDVEIRTCCVQIASGKKKPRRQYLILRADEADFHQETGEIEARGNVHLKLETTPEPAKSKSR